MCVHKRTDSVLIWLYEWSMILVSNWLLISVHVFLFRHENIKITPSIGTNLCIAKTSIVDWLFFLSLSISSRFNNDQKWQLVYTVHLLRGKWWRRTRHTSGSIILFLSLNAETLRIFVGGCVSRRANQRRSFLFSSLFFATNVEIKINDTHLSLITRDIFVLLIWYLWSIRSSYFVVAFVVFLLISILFYVFVSSWSRSFYFGLIFLLILRAIGEHVDSDVLRVAYLNCS